MRKNGHRLKDIFMAHEGRVIDKVEHYFDIYDKHVSKFIGTDVRVLEIGVGYGGSLQMWREYFGDKAEIFGLDIKPECIAFGEKGIEIFIGDQGNIEFMEEIAEKLNPLDIVIDDGGHKMKQQIISFNHLFPIINDNGVYVCEDTLTSYDKKYDGGYKRQGSFIEFIKDEIDRQMNPDSGLYGIHFYPWMVVIEKQKVIPKRVRTSDAPE